MTVPHPLHMLIRVLPNDVMSCGCSAGHNPASLPGVPQRVWSAGQRQGGRSVIQVLFSWSMELAKRVCKLTAQIILMTSLLNSFIFCPRI